MTDKNKTLLGILVDRSGSMMSIKTDMEQGLAYFLSEQSQVPGEALVTLAQFDAKYDLVYKNTPIADVPEYKIPPRGSTALNDAVGRFVTEIGEDLYALPENQRPGKVIINIITDGQENSSREWKLEAVRKLLDQQRDVYSWEFIFMGSDLSTEKTAAGYGIASSHTFNYAGDVAGGMRTASGLTRSLRS